MTFICHPECPNSCCGPVGISRELWDKHKHKFEHKLDKILPYFGTDIIPACKDMKCIFLENKQCQIYDERPPICRAYGIREDIPCAYVKPNGNFRSLAKRTRMQRWINKQIDQSMEALKNQIK